MPTVRLRKRLLDRLVQGVNTAGELGLALLMTAGVVHCGGAESGPGPGSADGAVDHGLAVEAAQEGGTVVEVAYFPDGYPMVEAPAPPPDSGVVVEVASFIDAGEAGADAAHSPMIEAPIPAKDGG
jgi:hypothetical protein